MKVLLKDEDHSKYVCRKTWLMQNRRAYLQDPTLENVLMDGDFEVVMNNLEREA